jgi:magnesium-protoporphyrin O-methyltransferase
MHAIGQWFPRGDRSPAIIPVSERVMRGRLADSSRFGAWEIGRTERIAHGFYTSQALELRRVGEVG